MAVRDSRPLYRSLREMTLERDEIFVLRVRLEFLHLLDLHRQSIKGIPRQMLRIQRQTEDLALHRATRGTAQTPRNAPDQIRTGDLRLERRRGVRTGSGIVAAMRPKCDLCEDGGRRLEQVASLTWVERDFQSKDRVLRGSYWPTIPSRPKAPCSNDSSCAPKDHCGCQRWGDHRDR